MGWPRKQPPSRLEAPRRTRSAPGLLPPPAELGEAGAGLWRSVVGTFRLDQHELATLESACRELDRAHAADLAVAEAGAWLVSPSGLLRAHPALAAGRASRLASAKLVRTLALPKET